MYTQRDTQIMHKYSCIYPISTQIPGRHSLPPPPPPPPRPPSTRPHESEAKTERRTQNAAIRSRSNNDSIVAPGTNSFHLISPSDLIHRSPSCNPTPPPIKSPPPLPAPLSLSRTRLTPSLVLSSKSSCSRPSAFDA